MSFTEDCEMYLQQLGVDTEKMTNREIRELYGEVTDTPIEW